MSKKHDLINLAIKPERFFLASWEKCLPYSYLGVYIGDENVHDASGVHSNAHGMGYEFANVIQIHDGRVYHLYIVKLAVLVVSPRTSGRYILIFVVS
jgi:hypothetical protein